MSDAVIDRSVSSTNNIMIGLTVSLTVKLDSLVTAGCAHRECNNCCKCCARKKFCLHICLFTTLHVEAFWQVTQKNPPRASLIWPQPFRHCGGLCQKCGRMGRNCGIVAGALTIVVLRLYVVACARCAHIILHYISGGCA